MGTTNIINQEQARKLGQNKQAVGKQFMFKSIYIWRKKTSPIHFEIILSSRNQPTFNVFDTCADYPVHRHLQFQDFSCPQYFSVYSVFFNFKILHFPVHRHSRFSRFQLPAECRMKIKPVMMLIILYHINICLMNESFFFQLHRDKFR